jgi:hypothetical protein
MCRILFGVGFLFFSGAIQAQDGKKGQGGNE